MDHQKPETIVSCLDDDLACTQVGNKYVEKLEECATAGKTVLHFADQFPGAQRNNYESESMTWYDGRGNLSFLTNDVAAAERVKSWMDTDRYLAPRCMEDIDTPEFQKLIEQINEDKAEKECLTALAADAEQEAMHERQGSLRRVFGRCL